MFEAIRDIIIGECRSIHGCTIEHNEIGNYKYLSSQSETIKNQSKFDNAVLSEGGLNNSYYT